MKKHQVVIVGNGMVGHYFVQQLLSSQFRELIEITVFCGEKDLAYDRVHLSEFFSGKTRTDLAMATSSEYEKNDINLYQGITVRAIDKEKQQVIYDGGTYSYDSLVIATGSYPFVPPILGRDRINCFVYRTLDDLDAIKLAAEQCRVGTVIGGGLLGLEAANALRNLGLETHVVEFAPTLMSQQLDRHSALLLEKKIEALGVRVHTSKATEMIAPGYAHQHCLRFKDGASLETDMVVFSAGIRPNDQLGALASLELGKRGGIAIDNHCQTSVPNIYAIGEVASWQNKVYGLVSPGYEMARIAVGAIESRMTNSLSTTPLFTGCDLSTRLKLLGIEVCSIGDAKGETPGAMSYSLENQVDGITKIKEIDKK